MAKFEDEYMDVLQNIEVAIVQIYRSQPALVDFEVKQAVNNLLRAYQAEQRGRDFTVPAQSPLTQQVYDDVRAMCEWRLGRDEEAFEGGPPPELLGELTVGEIVDCLKRIRKSVKLWNKDFGRQGYLNYIDNFFPG